MLRAPGNFPKVTKVLFNAQGNKVKLKDFNLSSPAVFGRILGGPGT